MLYGNNNIEYKKNDKNIFIVGGGTSLMDIDFSVFDNVETIAINESILHLSNPTYFITVDYEWLERKKGTDDYFQFQCSNASKFLVLNTCPSSRLVYRNNQYFHLGTYYDLHDYDIVLKAPMQRRFGDFHNFAHGENSGFCALQLAIIMEYDNIYLCGFDLIKNESGETHYHNKYLEVKRPENYYKNKLELFYECFKYGIINYTGKSKIFSCSSISRLNNIIPYVNLTEAIDGIH